MNPDPLRELTPGWTPYRFAFNNPAFFNDPTGLWEGDEGDQGDPFFQWDSHNGEHSDFWNIMNGNWDVNLDALATGDWSQEDMYDDFGAEGYDFDFDNSSNAENDNSDNTQYPNIEYINSNYTNILGDPPYEYNGKTYNNKTSLYAAILVEQFAEQFGIKDIIALAAALDGTFPSLDKPFTTPGSSSKTSYASKYGSELLPQKMPSRLPTHISGGKMRYTKVLGRFLGRVAGPIGWAVLAYDVGMSLYNTQVMYLKIITQ